MSGWMRVLLVVLVAAMLAALIALGTWQVQRLQWKEALLSRIETQLAMPPVPITEIEALVEAGEPVEYRPASATGRFDHARERHFFATFQGMSGFYVYTPLILEDGRAFFVNRGFVPYDRKEAATRVEGQLDGVVTITGLARERLGEKPSWLVPDNDPAQNLFYWKELELMASSAGVPQPVLPFFLDADETPNPGGLPAGGVTIIDLPNNHLQYAATWYGLAAALLAVSAVFFWRNRQPPSRRHGDSA